MECPHCNKSNEDRTGKSVEMEYCMWCGKSTKVPTCPSCKIVLDEFPEDISFCPKCGTDLIEIKEIRVRKNVTKEMLRIAKGYGDTKEFISNHLSNLPTRFKGAILRTGFTPVQLLTYSDDVLITMRQFGIKGLEELDEVILNWKNELAKEKLEKE